LIAQTGYASRRRAEELIRQGRVTVDGATATIGQKVDAATARVAIDGIPLPVRPGAAYYLVYKPPGVISTRADDRGRPTVVDMVPEDPPVYPVGRLDADSEGLLILTNDGDLTHRLTHPSFEVTKTYLVRTRGRLTKRDVKRLESGVDLDDGPAAALRARLIDGVAGGSLVEVVMGEGRKREVRRMITVLGADVDRLVRTAIGGLTDKSLEPGTWRRLSPAEVRKLYATSGRGEGDAGSWENAADEGRTTAP